VLESYCLGLLHSRDEIKVKGLDYVEPTTLEEEYEPMVKNQNLDAWEQKRIQRPWKKNQINPNYFFLIFFLK